MLRSCFYVLLVLGFAMNISFTDTTLLTEPYKVSVSILTIWLRNLKLMSASIPPMSLNFTSDEIALHLEGPAYVSASVESRLLSIGSYMTTSADITLTGGIEITKDSPNTCGSNAVTVGACDLKANINVRGLSFNLDMCENAATLLTSALNPEATPLEPLPALGAGDTTISKGSFFKALATKVALGNLLGARGSATFASDTAMHFNYRMLFPISATVDTREWSATAGARLLGKLAVSLWDSVKKTYNLPSLDSFVSATITDALGGNVSISMSSADGFFADLVNNNASLYFSAYVPKEAGVDFDLVANDHQCKLFGLACSIPASHGLEVMNTRISGLGDADAIFSNLLANTTEELLNRIVTDLLTYSSVEVGERRMLSII